MIPVFTRPFILNAFHLLLDKLLPLTSADLENLEDEPEEWLVAENNDEEAWAFEFRVSPLHEILDRVELIRSHVPRESSSP